jgi:carbamoyltransferase
MLILGLCCYHHDSSACLIADGKLVTYIEEERLSRVKHTSAFPAMAIRRCLEEAGATIADVDRAAYFWVPWKGVGRRLMNLKLWVPRTVRRKQGRYDRFGKMAQVPLQLRRELGYRGRFHFIDHYLAHAAASYFLSPYDGAATLILDGNGEVHTSWAGEGIGSRLDEAYRHHFPNSLGRVYGFTTDYLGYSEHSEEGKVMAMAAMGDPDHYLDRFRKIVQLRPEGRFQVEPGYFNHHIEHRVLTTQRFIEEFGPRRHRSAPLEQRHYDIAAALQRVTEEAVLHQCRHLAQSTGQRHLCLGGGVALNCAMNGRIAAEGLFDEVFIPPPAGDAGAALGAALYVHHEMLGGPRTDPLLHPYWGPSYDSAACQRAVAQRRIPYRVSDDPCADAAQWIADGKVVGWFQGGMEMGPRALGARSIVADPRDPKSCDRINAKVKNREVYQPFAPAVLEERCNEVFDCSQPSPFMLMAFQAQPEARERIPAVCHLDGSGRVQSVGEHANPRYRRLIEEFDKLTGVPVVLNTSFNRRGEPIVCSPVHALDCFLESEMDALVLEDVLLIKNENGKVVAEDRDA